MPKIVISDTSTLILFHKIDEFSLLQKVYGELITTPEIAEEFGEDLPDWIKIQSVSDKKYQIQNRVILHVFQDILLHQYKTCFADKR